MPATVIKDPLGIAAVFSDGTSVSLKVNVRAGGKTYSTRNLVLARDMLSGLADLVHPHGDVDATRTLIEYTSAIRALTNGLADLGFTGGAAELTRAHLAEHWLRGEHRAAIESLSRRMLARMDDLSGLLKPDVREMVDGRQFQVARRSRTESSLVPYTEGEWARLTEACEKAVKDSYSAFRRARSAAEGGEDPLTGGWSEANVYWAYLRWGPLEGKPYVDWSPGHFSGLPEGQFPYRKVAVSARLFTDASTVLAYRLLLGGPVPEWWTPLSPAPAGAGQEGSLMVMKVYSPEFKADAVALYLSHPSHTFEGIGKDLGISRETLRNWVRAERARHGGGSRTSTSTEMSTVDSPPTAEELQVENEALRRELAAARKEMHKLATERDILRKATKFFAQEMTW